MFNIPRYLLSHPKRLVKKIKEWAGKIEQQQQREDLSKKIAKQFEGYVWKMGEHPNCRCAAIPIKSKITSTEKHQFKTGDPVIVCDRYRFAIPLIGMVARCSDSNDGVEVVLHQSNSTQWPIGSTVWVHETQLEKREVKQ